MREPTGEIPSVDGGEAIVIPVGQGRIVRFDEPAESVFVGDPSIADVHVVAPDVVYIFGKRHGNTNLLAISKDEDTEASGKKIQVSSLIRVMTDAQPAQRRASPVEPNNAVKLSFMGKRATAKGKVKSVPEAVDVAQTAQTFSEQPPLNNTTISGSQQVNIRIRFAEIQRGNLQSFGIDWHVMAGNFSIGVINTTALGSSSSGSSGLGMRAKGSNFDVSLLVEALERNGLVTILAEPNLTAMTGQTANFLAGEWLLHAEFHGTQGRHYRRACERPIFCDCRAFQRQMTRDLAKFPVLGDIPPAKPGALNHEPLKAATGVANAAPIG